jgi:hypothetical protein
MNINTRNRKYRKNTHICISFSRGAVYGVQNPLVRCCALLFSSFYLWVPVFSVLQCPVLLEVRLQLEWSYNSMHVFTYPGIAWLIRRVFGFHDRIYWTPCTTGYNTSQITICHTVIFFRLDTTLELFWLSTDLSLQSQIYVTTEGQSASLSWCHALIWDLRPDFITVRQLRVCWYGALSLTREWVCRLQLLLALASAVILGSESRRRPYFTVSVSRHPNLEGQVPVFISPKNRVAQLCPQALGSLFVAFYDSLGYGGGIRNRLHAGYCHILSSYDLASGRTTAQKTHPLPSNGYMRTHIENTSCDTSSIVACAYCGRCLEMDLLSCWLRICCVLVYRVVA